MKYVLILLYSLPALCIAQNTIVIQGTIKNEKGANIGYAMIAEGKKVTIANEKGLFSLKTEKKDSITLSFSAYGYEPITKTIRLTESESLQIIILKQNAIAIPKVQIVYNKEVEDNITYLNSEKATSLPGLSLSGIEGSIKTFAGVSSKSELSSQYSVRGGSYDENLVYINGIPAFKPNLTRSDKQEGLSIINPYMVGNIEFSSGGFGPQYGDKLSSVLLVNYKDITEKSLQFDCSLLDANLTYQGLDSSKKFTYIISGRYKNTSLLLSTLDENGEYRPEFYDLQSFLTYKFSKKLSVSYWLYGANNTYHFIPKDRITDFGGQVKTFRMKIYFEGNEHYVYQNLGNSVSFKYKPNEQTNLDFNFIQNYSSETESFDVFSQYRLSEIIAGEDENVEQDSSSLLAIGSFLDHGRNSLQSSNSYFSHNGKTLTNFCTYSWGTSVSIQDFNGKFNEWTFIDSANYSLPYSDTSIVLKNTKNAVIPLQQNSGSAYILLSKKIDFENTERSTLKVHGGIRFTFDNYTDKILYNPRIRMVYKPSINKSVTYSFASGVYYQLLQFKELIDDSGTLYTAVKPQKSIHYVLGVSKNILIWNRPFIFQTEVYYKDLQNIIPYTIQNVSTTYHPQYSAKGYIGGIDTKLNGEFVPGVESWVSLSVMQAKEKLKDGTSDIIRRPNDQLINFGIFFQDFLPGSENVKMNLTYLLGSKIPTAIPTKDYNKFDDFNIPMYNRIDLGFLYTIFGEDSKFTSKNIKNLSIGAEIFNFFDNANKISYFWIQDVNNNYYGVPNYLTSRRLNVKLSLKI